MRPPSPAPKTRLSTGPNIRASQFTAAPLWLKLVSLIITIGFSFPSLYLLWRSLSENAAPLNLLSSTAVLEPLARTLMLATAVSLTAAFSGTALAWITTRTDLPAAALWRVLLTLPLAFPTFIGAAALIRTINPGGLLNEVVSSFGLERTPELHGFYGAWYVLSLFTYPYVFLSVSAAFTKLPSSLEESARVLGDNVWHMFWRICIPQVWPAIASGSLLVILYTISDFGAVELLRYDTLARAIYTNRLFNRPVALALSLTLLTLAALIIVCERHLSKRAAFDNYQRDARSNTKYQLGRWKPLALSAVITTGAAGLGGPMLALTDWALQAVSIVGKDKRTLTIDLAAVANATLTTLNTGVLTALVAVVAVMPIAFLTGRFRSRLGTFSHTIIISTFALPGILIALSMRFWTLKNGLANTLLSNSLALLIFAYVVRFGSLAMGLSVNAVSSVPNAVRDAATVLGAGRYRRLLSVEIPLMAPGLAAAAGLVLLSVMKELPISLLVAPIGYSTLATKIFVSFEDAFVAEAGIMSLLLVCLSFLGSWFLIIRRSQQL